MTPTLAQVTKGLLAAYNRFPRKHLGQHFLVDPLVVRRIIDAAELGKDDLVIEIGSGLGVVTAELAREVYQLIAVEIDRELLGISQEVLKEQKNVSFVGNDILKIELADLALGRKYKVVGNLPYYITAPIVEKLLTAAEKPERAVIMVQKEVAQRMVAAPGSKQYGSFAIFCQFHAKIKLESLVSKSSFLPWPEVSSAIVSLTPHSSPLFPGLDEQKYFKIVHTAFQQRRKKLSTSLDEFKLGVTSIDLNRRPETLSIEEFAALAKRLV
ncbi:MAG: 16S rRNA (adenine(1518)-N(6)/adenine(1519)-N(6))-dimethyltransferase RsmA [Candidatus Margulisiibacteriota bacterium]